MLNGSLYVRLLGDIALQRFDFAGHVWDDFLGLADGFGERGLRDVAHQYRGAFAEEEDGRFQADASGNCKRMLTHIRPWYI